LISTPHNMYKANQTYVNTMHNLNVVELELQYETQEKILYNINPTILPNLLIFIILF
jgi:hypothetical protein